MAGYDYYHTAEILHAAMPYVDYRTQTFMDFYTKFLEFMGSYNNFTHNTNVAACGFEDDHIDFEGLLAGIRPVCNVKERELVDNILNIFNAKRVFETYNTYMSAMKSMQGQEDTFYSDTSYDTEYASGSVHGAEAKSNQGGSSNPGNNSNQSGNQSANQSSNQQNNGFNPNMLNMLKAFVPPEQASTFENLSMLFNTMSYDSNKSDNS